MTGLHVAPTPPQVIASASAAGSAESFHRTVGVVVVICSSGDSALRLVSVGSVSVSVTRSPAAGDRVTLTLTEPTLTSRSAESPLLQMTTTTPTVLWNDSADPAELAEAITWGCVGATCNPVIAYSTIKKHQIGRAS